MRRVAVVTAFVVVVALLGGCGSTSTKGSAVAAGPSNMSVAAFDPCSQLSDAMISSLGLEPSTKKPYTVKGTTVESGCGWDDAPTKGRLLVDIGVNNTQIDKYLAGLGYTNLPEQHIGGRRAFNFQTARALGTCSFALDLGGAVAIVATSSTSYVADVPDPDSCPDAVRIATAIAPLFR